LALNLIKLEVKMAKKWILAIASGRVEHVSALVQAGLKRRVGVKGLIAQYERAAVKRRR